jgi:hypothetical protein
MMDSILSPFRVAYALKRLHLMKTIFYKSVSGLALICGVISIPYSVWAKPTYDQLFPYYVESCAETQLVTKSGKGGGGIGGHDVLYIKGVCRDETAALPQLKLCDSSMDITDPDTGVGVSVNKEFDNINFEVTPKKSFFFFGTYKGGKLTQAVQDETIDAAKNNYRNVQLHPKYLKLLSADATEDQRLTYLSGQSVNTDFALAFARNSSCARVPIKKEMLGSLIDYLNKLNQKYYFGTEGYNWQGLTNNCTHLTHNGIASLGIYPSVPTEDSAIEGVARAEIEAPANEFIGVMQLTNETSLNVVSLFHNPLMRETFLKYNWLPVREGGILEAIPGIHDNDIYKVNHRIIIPPGCVTSKYCKEGVAVVRWEDMHHLKHFTNLRSNLKRFELKYRVVLATKLPPTSLVYQALLQPGEFDAFKDFHEKYFEYIADELNTVINLEKVVSAP